MSEKMRISLQSKPTEELLAIWVANKRTTWSEKAFKTIAETLTERGVDLPPQQAPPEPPPQPFSREKDIKLQPWLMGVLIAVPVLIIMFLIGMMFLALMKNMG